MAFDGFFQRQQIMKARPFSGLVELADTADLGSVARQGVRVRVPHPLPFFDRGGEMDFESDYSDNLIPHEDVDWEAMEEIMELNPELYDLLTDMVEAEPEQIEISASAIELVERELAWHEYQVRKKVG